jgi:AraC family transcriptional activator of pobA
VRAYAGTLGVTPDHLSRSCRAITGLGALDLLHERLLLEARRLLAYSPAAVGDIAHQLGFDDPGYFSRLFTKRAGQSPSAYRASIADGLGVLPNPPRGLQTRAAASQWRQRSATSG